ncbi:MAG: 6-pyruvoyl-tetrahydropterin synthase-related protein [Chloroflexota bacterium]
MGYNVTMTTTNPTLKDLPLTEDDLPIWMRRAMRGNDWGALLTVGFSALVAWYFILSPTLPQFTATENYVFMVQDYADAFSEGRLYPRWAAHAESGYGAPIYHYQPPGATYLGGIITALFNNNPVAAVRTVYLIGFMLAGVGTYGIVVRHRGAAAAVLAAMLYVTSPYIGITAPHALGNLNISLALGLLPVLLWSVDRLVYANYPQDFPFVVLTFATLILTSPRVAAAGGVLSIVLVMWHLTQRNPRLCRPRIVIIALLTGLLLTTFYWFPAIAERYMVYWQPQTLTGQPVFVTLAGLLAPYRQIDTNAIVPAPHLGFGWLRLMLITLSIPGVLLVQRRFTMEALTLLCGTVITAVVVLVFPLETWLIGVATLCFSASVGAALSFRDRFSERTQRLVLAIVLMVILGASRAAWLPPQSISTIPSPTPGGQVQHEASGYGVAVVPPGRAYPTTLPRATSPVNELLRSYRDGDENLNRSAPTRQSNRLRVSPLTESAHAARFQISGDGTERVTLAVTYFPGWRARVNQRRMSVTPGEAGLLSVQSPAVTNGTLVVWLGTTLFRRGAWLVSLMTAAGMLWFVQRRYRYARPQYHEVKLLTLPEARLILLLLLLSAGVVYFAARFNAPLSIRAAEPNPLASATNLDLRTTAGLNLLAYDLNTTRFQHGETLQLALYWSALQEITQNYRVQVTLFGIDRTISLGKAEIRYPGGLPPTRWTQNRTVRDLHYIEISRQIPPGEYLVEVTLELCDVNDLSCDPADRPRFFERDGFPVGQIYDLPATIEVIE